MARSALLLLVFLLPVAAGGCSRPAPTPPPEGFVDVLVDPATGARQAIPAVPILAPDCARLAVASGPPAASVLQIWRVSDSGRLVMEWGYQPEEDWAPGVPRWTDAVRIEMPYAFDSDPQTRRALAVRLHTDGWRVQP